VIQLSVVVIAKNEEHNIGRALESVKPVADEIVVVDSGSTDRTEEICRTHGARFITHAFEGHIQQKNWAMAQAANPHVLSLDIIEALSDELARRWQAGEVAKRSLTDPAEILALGTAQTAVLEGFQDACDKRKRRDLATFIIDAIQPLIDRNIIPAPAQLDPSAPLSVRANARASAGSLLRALLRWSQWDNEHRGIRYIDDDYAQAQVLLGRFEKIGSAGVSRVEGWLADLASLAPTTPATEPAN